MHQLPVCFGCKLIVHFAIGQDFKYTNNGYYVSTFTACWLYDLLFLWTELNVHHFILSDAGLRLSSVKKILTYHI